MRLGFSVKPRGRPGLKPYDTRRWQNSPHLSVSLAYLRDILLYLNQKGISMYRMDARLAPYLTHPDLPQFHGQIEECREELAHVGGLARGFGIRLSFHAPLTLSLSTPDEGQAARTLESLDSLAGILDAMGLSRDSVVVAHGGGIYDDRKAAIERLIARIEQATERVRRRLVLEHDSSFTIADLYRVYRRTGIPLVYDHLHYLNEMPRSFPFPEAVSLALSTWPRGMKPKVHFSTPLAMAREVKKPGGGMYLKPPSWREHSDFVNPFSFMAFVQATSKMRDFDVMLEARATDLALLKLEMDLKRFAPGLLPMSQEASRAVSEDEEAYWGPFDWEPDEEPERVLVAVVNNKRDFERVKHEKWYRIPVDKAPPQIGADYLAFYQTGAFGREGHSVRYMAPVIRYSLAKRGDLIPEEGEHPRAGKLYYKISLGELVSTPKPLQARKLRRVTFIPTTVELLREASDVAELWFRSRVRQESPRG